jgi:hypothetical protein
MLNASISPSLRGGRGHVKGNRPRLSPFASNNKRPRNVALCQAGSVRDLGMLHQQFLQQQLAPDITSMDSAVVMCRSVYKSNFICANGLSCWRSGPDVGFAHGGQQPLQQ